MKSTYLQVLIWLFCVQGYGGNKSFKVIWAIGKADNSVAEFALFPNGFKKFIENDFGYEDNFYLIGHSNKKKRFSR